MAATYFSEREGSSADKGASPSTGPSVKTNALQNRITAVLSASYADLEIRDALSALDEQGLQNTAETRRALRLNVQDELIQCNGQIVRDFGRVADQLQRIGTAIASLNSSCAQMRTHIASTKRETGPMLDEAKSLLADKKQVETKQQLFNAFVSHFVLSDADVAALTSTAEPVNDDFFRVLSRVKKIHEDCQVLLGAENQRLGLEILEQSTRQLNAAYQKLFRWTQREFKALDLENIQLSGPIRRALWLLAERPQLFQSCLDSFAEARQQNLSQNFYAALTGAPVDVDHPIMGKAIELSAHDPLRYVSDMLAWAHSATVSEREALGVLFISDGDQIARNIQTGYETDVWTRADEEEPRAPFDGRKALNGLIDKNLTDVLRQLKQRTEQVIHSHADALLAYRISSLISFYANIFTGLLGEDSSLLETLQKLVGTALRAFRSGMRDHVAGLQTDLSLSPDDLAPPDFLIEALETLRTLMQSFDTSFVHMNRSQRVEQFEPILQEAFDPYLSGCENISRRLRGADGHIFALNCLFAAKESLSLYSFADRSEEIQPLIEGHEAQLAEALHTWILNESGMKSLVDSIASPSDLATSYKDPNQLATVAQELDAFLPTATEDARAHLVQLENKALARRVIEQASERFCEDFENVKLLIAQADEARAAQLNGETEEDLMLSDVFPRTSDEIRVLLS